MSHSTASVPSHAAPYVGLPSATTRLFEAKARKGLTFDEIAKAIEKDEIWVASAFYGQAKFSPEQLNKIAEILELDLQALASELGAHWWPNRGDLGPVPPTDPVLYRLFEGVLVYGHPIKAVLHEKFGDGIFSMVDCKVTLDRKADAKGDRAVLSFDAKFMPYPTW